MAEIPATWAVMERAREDSETKKKPLDFSQIKTQALKRTVRLKFEILIREPIQGTK